MRLWIWSGYEDNRKSAMMDSRTKILPPEAAPAWWRGRDPRPVVVTGYFDPVVASHVRRLKEIAGGAGRLLVLVHSPEDPILPLEARVRLVAGLRVVEAVVPCGKEELEGLLNQLPGAKVVREESGDLHRTAELVRHVRERRNAG